MTTDESSSTAGADAPRQRRGPSTIRTRGNIEDFGSGRKCAVAGCKTLISRYHSGGLCWVHDDDPPKK
jgi:hypothetical protein